MVETASGSTDTQIVYGPQGRFATMNGQTTLVKAYIPLPGGAQAIYTSASLLTTNKIAYYRHMDHLDSSRLGTTPTQTLYSSTAYAPFGESYSQAGATDLSFTGQEQDTVSGIYDFMARKYPVAQGRWLSPDPGGLAVANPANPQSWNRYAYVSDNPLALVDPMGYGQCDASGAEIPGMNFNAGFDCPGSEMNSGEQAYVSQVPWYSVKDGHLVLKFTIEVFFPGTMTDCNEGVCGSPTDPVAVFVPGEVDLGAMWQLAQQAMVPDHWWSDFAGNLFSWSNFKAEFKDGGCVAVFGDEMAGTADSTTAGQDEAIKATANSTAWGTAAVYAAERGLTVPLRSSIVRGILRVGEKGGTAVTLLLTIKDEAEALHAEVSAMSSGRCR